jgi:diaminobutyrate-2-oxoglutarate transaminase
MDVFSNFESEVRNYIRAFPVIFDTAKGSYITDTSGKRYLDFLSGAGALNYGHNEPHLMEGAIKYLKENGICHSLDMATLAKQSFLETFVETVLRRRNLNYKVQFTGPTGASAVEAALMIARKTTGRSGIISFTNGYHGMSLGALAATSDRYYKNFPNSLPSGHSFMPFENYLGDEIDTIAIIERYLADSASGVDLPAAFIVETVQGEGGVRVASSLWLQRLEALARRLGSLLIVDEVQTGCGRCGHFFSFERAGIVPDIVTLSKSLSGSGFPLSIVLLRPEHDIWRPGEYSGTFRGNNLAFVTADLTIRKYWTSEQFSLEVFRKGALLEQRLQDMARSAAMPGVTVRGLGMLFGLDCGSGKVAERVTREAFKRSLIIERCGNLGQVVKCMPPLNTADELLKEALEILKESLRSAID